MAKERHTQETKSSSGATLAILVVGIILVAALIVWAMTRTVAPAATTADTSNATMPSTPPITPALPAGSTPPLPGVTTPPVSEHSQSPEKAAITRIAAEDLRAKMNRNEVTVLDVRDTASYAREHITGATNTPFASLEAQIDSLPKGKPIVTYCT